MTPIELVNLAKEARTHAYVPYSGYAVGAATDEERRRGINAWKRDRLKKAGAAMIIPDFADVERLTKYLLGEK